LTIKALPINFALITDRGGPDEEKFKADIFALSKFISLFRSGK
jgi:hypothetical protein